MNKDNTILVTGATGNQGGAVAKELLAHGYKVRAMTRKPGGDKAKELSRLGTEIVEGDMNEPSSLEKALSGAWGVFAVQNTWEAGVEQEEVQGKQLAAASKKAGVHHYVYTSVASAQRQTGIPHFENKWRVEQTIRELAFPSWTIIRPVFFMENLLGPWFMPAIAEGKVTVGIPPQTKLQMIAVSDIGKYGFAAFEKHEQLNGKAIDLAGDELTMPQVAETLSKITGRNIVAEPTPIEAVRQFSADFASMLEWFVRVGYDANIAELTKTFGFKPLTFGEWASSIKW